VIRGLLRWLAPPWAVAGSGLPLPSVPASRIDDALGP